MRLSIKSKKHGEHETIIDDEDYEKISEGVRRNGKSKKNPWQAFINHNKNFIHLGCFPTEIEAARTYNEKAVEIFGKFAKLNEVE